jgi:hypothetical protein
VRGLFLPLSLVLAAVATAGLMLIVLRGPAGPAPVPEETDAREAATLPELAAVRERKLRAYETTLTLAEDLRDALPGPPEALERELWRVSRTLRSKASWTLQRLARQEASPRVRALLVLAAGVHLPDAESLLRFLDDPHPTVRTAAVLACGYREEGPAKATLLGTLTVPVGRRPDDTTRADLQERRGAEEEASVRAAIDVVLSPAR